MLGYFGRTNPLPFLPSLDPTTYKLYQNSIKIKKVDPVEFGPIQCSCCYDYSMKSIDLAKVKDVEVMSVSAPCHKRFLCCAKGEDLVELHPTDNSYGNLVLKVGPGDGQKVSRLILAQVEKNQIIERD